MLRGYKEKSSAVLTGSLAGMVGAQRCKWCAAWAGSSTCIICKWKPPTARQDKTGAKLSGQVQNAIIAAGSQVVNLPFHPQDPHCRFHWRAGTENPCRRKC